jgi:hypothetical protein
MPGAGAARSCEFRIFETDEFRKTLARVGAPRFVRKKLDMYV